MPRPYHRRNQVIVKTPSLPQGVKIGEIPKDIDLMTVRKGKYDWVLQALNSIDGTKTIQFDLSTIPFESKKRHTSAIKNGIMCVAKRYHYPHKIKWGELDGVFHVWTNK